MNRTALQQCSYGVYIIGARNGGRLNGQIATTVCQVASEPATVSVSINKQNLTHELISRNRVFSVSILGEKTPLPFIGRFGFTSGREADKFEGINYKLGQTGAPIVLDHATSYMDCELVASMDAGTHTIFLGRVLDAQVVSDGRPMTYEYYHRITGGRSPKTAPTYAGPNDEELLKKEATTTAKYQCKICGYVYDPAKGDPDAGRAAGTAFGDLPDSWVCPICGAAKTEFEKMG